MEAYQQELQLQSYNPMALAKRVERGVCHKRKDKRQHQLCCSTQPPQGEFSWLFNSMKPNPLLELAAKP